MDSVFQWISHWFAGSTLIIVFLTGFLSATLLPGGSEVTLLAALTQQQHPVYLLIIMATLGNTLGGLTNYLIGLWLPLKSQEKQSTQKALFFIQRYGLWALLFSWLPVIGDLLCLVAGWLKMRLLPVAVLIMIGKLIRYMLLTAIFYGVI